MLPLSLRNIEPSRGNRQVNQSIKELRVLMPVYRVWGRGQSHRWVLGRAFISPTLCPGSAWNRIEQAVRHRGH